MDREYLKTIDMIGEGHGVKEERPISISGCQAKTMHVEDISLAWVTQIRPFAN